MTRRRRRWPRTRWDALRRRTRARLLPPALGLGGGQGGQRLVGRPLRARLDADGRIGAQILLRRPRPLPWAFAYAPRGPVATAWTPSARGAFTSARAPATCRARVGPRRHLRIDPEIEAGRAARRRRRAPRRARRPPAGDRPRRSSPPPTRIIDLRADEDALWGDLRKKWRQYVNKARTAGIAVVDADGDRLAGVLPDLSRDRGSGRVPDPHRGGLPRRLGRVPPERPRPAAVRPGARRRAARDAVPGPLRAAGRGAVRRDDRRPAATRGPTTCSSGRPSARRARRAPTTLRPVGPRDRRDRPLQDRVRRPRGPLHRGVGPRPRSGSGGPSSTIAQRGRVWLARRRHGLARVGQRGGVRGRAE